MIWPRCRRNGTSKICANAPNNRTTTIAPGFCPVRHPAPLVVQRRAPCWHRAGIAKLRKKAATSAALEDVL